MFSKRFMLFPTLKKKIGVNKKFGGGGGLKKFRGGGGVEKKRIILQISCFLRVSCYFQL